MKPRLSVKLLLTFLIVIAGLSVYSNFYGENKQRELPVCPKSACCKSMKNIPAQPTQQEILPWQNFSVKFFL